jgi:hypothetical protein
MFFFAVAMLIESEDVIMKAEFASLPVIMASIRIKDQKEL